MAWWKHRRHDDDGMQHGYWSQQACHANVPMPLYIYHLYQKKARQPITTDRFCCEYVFAVMVCTGDILRLKIVESSSPDFRINFRKEVGTSC